MLIRRLCLIVAVAAVALSGCSSAPKRATAPVPKVDRRQTVGGLDVVLGIVHHGPGVYGVAITVTNSTDTTVPAQIRGNYPWLVDQAGGSVEETRSTRLPTRIVARGVSGMRPSQPDAIGPGGQVTVTDTFNDPGPGAALYYNPISGRGPDSRPDANTAAWKAY